MVVDLFLVYQFIRRLATPFNKWKAYDLGVIDDKGEVLIKKKDRDSTQRKAWGIFDRMIANLKKLLAKVPGGGSKLASYAAALYLIKEWNHFSDESMLNEDISDEQLDESILLFSSVYLNYINEDRNVNLKMMLEAKEIKPSKPPSFKRAGPDGEIEIKFPSGRKFLIRKQLNQNLDHERGMFQILEWDRGDWEWHETAGPKAYAKEVVLKMGMMNKNHTKIVADYSSYMTKYDHAPIADKTRTINFNEELEEACWTGYKQVGMKKKNGKEVPNCVPEDKNKVDTKPELEEEPANNVGSGNIAGMDGGHMSKAGQKKWTSSNKSNKKKRLRDIMGDKT